MLTLQTVPACAHRVADLAGFCADRQTAGFEDLRCGGRVTRNAPVSPAAQVFPVATPVDAATVGSLRRGDCITIRWAFGAPMVRVRVISNRAGVLHVNLGQRAYAGTASVKVDVATLRWIEKGGALRADTGVASITKHRAA